jgi:hypothetical protein
MRMQSRGARCGGDEHDDGPNEAVKHTPANARRMPWRGPSTGVNSRVRELRRLRLRAVNNNLAMLR